MSSKILKHTAIFSFFVLLAQVIGLVRDLYLLRFFGAGSTLDTYYLAFKIPDFLNLFYSVLLGSVILIPLLTKVFHEKGEKAVQKEINLIGSLVLSLVLFGTLLLYIFMPELAKLLAPTWNPLQQDSLTQISRTLLLAQLFFPIGVMFGAVGMIYEKPLGFACAGAVYNLFILLGGILLSPFYGIFGVVYGVIVGSFFFAIIQISNKDSFAHFKKFRLNFDFKYYLIFVKTNIWRFITVFLNQFYAVMIAALAATTGTGNVTLFMNSYNIYMAIFFAFGGAFATAIMPHVSKLHVGGEHEGVKDSLTNSLTNIFSLSIYFSIFIYFFAPEIISTLYFFSNLSILQEELMVKMLQILAFSIATINVIDVLRKYMYTIDMAYESIYVMLIFVPVVYVLFQVFSMDIFTQLSANISILALSLALTVGNVVTTICILLLVYFHGKIYGKFLMNSFLKTNLVSFLSFLTLILLQNFFSEYLLSNNLLIFIIIKFVTITVTISTFIYLGNDKIMKNIFTYIFSRVKQNN